MNAIFKMLKLIVASLFLSTGFITSVNSASLEVESAASQNSVSSSVSEGPTYNAEMQLQADEDGCIESATVEGNGVSDTLRLPCTKNKQEREVVNEKDKIVIGGDPGDSHGIIATKPNTLVVMEGGKCVEKFYPPGGEPTTRILSDEECAVTKKDMQATKKEAKEKEEKQKQEFENIGKDLASKTIDMPNLDFKDPFGSMDFGINI